MNVQIYTDGSTNGTGDSPGGYAAIMFVDGIMVDGVYGGKHHTTNNQMEMQAVIAALQMLPTFEAQRCSNCGVVDNMMHFPPNGPQGLQHDCKHKGPIQRPVYVDPMIISDSQYCVNGSSTWVHTWVANGWKTASKQPVKNRDLWEEILKLSKKHAPQFKWVKGHVGHAGNELADKWAGEARQVSIVTSKPWENTLPFIVAQNG